MEELQMKLKNRDIVSFINGCAALKEKKLPIKIGYAINRNIIALTEAAEAYNMAREKIIKEYAEKILKESWSFGMTAMYLKINRHLTRTSKNFSILIPR